MSLAGRIGPYELASKPGAGGMGEVFRARDTRLGRDEAIKVLPKGFTDDKERLARFEREAQLLVQLHAPGHADDDVERNGERLLIDTQARKGKTQPLSVVLNWSAGLKR
jgi:serine/threonine protein kinase